MRIYVNHTSVYSVRGSRIDTSLALSAGTHYVVVQSWDSVGTVQKAPMTVTVTEGSSGIPPTAKVYSGLDQVTGWESCDVCAGHGGQGPEAEHSLIQFIGSPSRDGKSAQFNLGGETPYSAALWWKQLGGNDSATRFVYDLYFYLKDPAASQALEFDINQTVNGKKYIFGTQCDIKDHKTWDVWDTANSRWVQTGIACAMPAAYTWHHLVLEFERVNDQAKFVSLTLNGKKSYINKVFRPKSGNYSELNVAFQLDGNKENRNYSAWLDTVKLSAW